MQGMITDKSCFDNIGIRLFEGNVYCLSGVSVVKRQPGFYIAKTDYQLLLTENTRISQMMEDCEGYPNRKYKLMKLSDIDAKVNDKLQLIGMLLTQTFDIMS